MSRGIMDPKTSKILTVDVTDRNPELHKTPGITKLTGDANTEYVIKKAVTFFDSDPIDLMFVDADHNFLPTITNIGVYASLLRPRMIVVDDIVLNRSMKSM
jgi:cephalosporin hydroxylase